MDRSESKSSLPHPVLPALVTVVMGLAIVGAGLIEAATAVNSQPLPLNRTAAALAAFEDLALPAADTTGLVLP